MLIWSLRTGPTEGAAAEGIPPSDTGLYRGNSPRKLGPRCPQGAFHTEVERLGANTPLASPAVGLNGPSGRLEPAPLCPARKNPGGAFGLLLSRRPGGHLKGLWQGHRALGGLGSALPAALRQP